MHFPIKDQNGLSICGVSNNSTGGRSSLSIPDFLDYRQQNQVFEDLAAYSGESFRLTNMAEPKRLGGGRVSFNYFHVLGVQPAMGRNFLPEESLAADSRWPFSATVCGRTISGLIRRFSGETSP